MKDTAKRTGEGPSGDMMMKLAACLLTLLSTLPAVDAADVSSKDVRNYTRELKVLLRTEDTFDLENFIDKMGELDHPKLVVLIPPAAVTLASARLYKRAVETIKNLESEKSIAALVDHVDKSKTRYQEKVLVLDAFAFRQDIASLEGLVENISHKIVHVRLTAIRAGLNRRVKDLVPALIDVLGKYEKMRDLTWLETRESLLAITGQDFESSTDWESWWEGSKAGFDPAKVGKDEGKTRVVVRKSKDAVEFFGSEIFSRNVLFVIDVSGSMVKYDDGDSRGRKVDQERQRLRRAKTQMMRALKLLPRSAKFNIIAFSDKVTSWQKTLKTAGRGSVASAMKFVNNFLARGGTHTDEALEQAFRDHNVDTVVLLSDGAPMKQDARDPIPLIEKILERVRDLNAGRKIRINTFGFDGVGKWPEKIPGQPPGPRLQPSPDEVKAFIRLMKTLAAENRGTYRAIK